MKIVVIKGGGDIGTGVAHRLHRSGFGIIVTEIEWPTVIRRKVAFAEAIFSGKAIVENVTAVRASGIKEIPSILSEDNIPVIADPAGIIVKEIKPDIFVDATLSKKNTGTHKGLAPVTIALGPGFQAGKEVSIVIETNRGHNLGSLIFEGYAEPNTGIPGTINGHGEDRVLRAPCDGKVSGVLDIGHTVARGDTVCCVGNEIVNAAIGGVIRGLIMKNTGVRKGFKIGDIDPRGVKEYCYTISDKARAIAGGVLEAILYMRNLKQH